MATDLIELQRRAGVQLRWLRGVFALAMTCNALLVAAAAALLLALVPAGVKPAFMQDHRLVGAAVAAAVLMGSLLTGLVMALRLRGGGASVARLVQATPAPPDTPAGRRLSDMVARLALAARIPAPAVFLLPGESGINAFAAGRTPEDAAIAVTSAALARLEREELQALLAHEISHIRNGDMTLNTRLVPWIWGLRTMGPLGLLAARVLQAAICRGRETLADASAVQLTRNSTALQSALLKADAAGMPRPGARAIPRIAHMLFAPERSDGGGLLQTHPPMEERVRTLAPALTQAQYHAALHIERRRLAGRRAGAARTAPPALEAVQDLLRDSLPKPLQEQVWAWQQEIPAAPDKLQALFVAALLETDTARARQQLLQLAPMLGAHVAAAVPRMRKVLFGLPAVARLPLLVGLLPALAALPARDRRRMLRTARVFGERLLPRDTLRFAVSRLLLRSLVRAAEPLRRGAWAVAQQNADAALGLLCSLVAKHCGAPAPAAFHAGMDGLVPSLRQPPFTADGIGAAAVDAALDTVARLPGTQRAKLCQALARMVGGVDPPDVGGLELLRLIGHSVGLAPTAIGAPGREAVS